MTLDPYRIRAVHLTAIWAYGVSQPVLSLVDGNPDLVVANGATTLDLVFFATLLTLVPPLLAIGYAWIAGRFSRWAGDVVFLALLGVFLVPVALQLTKRVDPGALAVLLLVCMLVVGGVVLYVRLRVVRLFVGFSIVLPILGLVWFLNGLPPLTADAHASRVSVVAPRPVVFVVFDELPLASLLTLNGEIDANRYPAFARLARDGVWYPNATTVHDYTFRSVPAMLTGRLPRIGASPVGAEQPENLFTLLAGTYSLKVHESAATRLCVEAACRQRDGSVARRLASMFADVRGAYLARAAPSSVSHYTRVVDFDTVMERRSLETLDEFGKLLHEVDSHASDRTLYFSHLYFPHAPWRFLPSGLQYGFKGVDGWLPQSESPDDNPLLVRQAHQRHLLQVGYTDVLLGRLLRRLDTARIYDRSLIVVIADHGVSFVPGRDGRSVTKANVGDIANVPLIVKFPAGQPHGVDTRGAKTIDVLPTIADVLGVDLPWKVEGMSLLARRTRDRPVVVHTEGGAVTVALASVRRQVSATVRRKVAAFGQGGESVYRVGVHKGLLGTPVDPRWPQSPTIRVRLDDERALAAVDRATGFIPSRISGAIAEGKIDPGVELAVAVNGRIVALTGTYVVDGNQRLQALVPDTALRDGANRVEVFAIIGQGHLVGLTRL